MEELMRMVKDLIQIEFSGEVYVRYDQDDNREVVHFYFYKTTPNTVMKIRKIILKSPIGIDCFTGGDIRLENDFEWEGNDKVYEVVCLDLYLEEEWFDNDTRVYATRW